MMTMMMANSRWLWNTLPQNVTSAPSLTVLQKTPEDPSLKFIFLLTFITSGTKTVYFFTRTQLRQKTR